MSWLKPKMKKGQEKISEVVGEFEGMVKKLEDGISLMNLHRTENETKIFQLSTENNTIAAEVITAEKVKGKIENILK